MRGPTTVDVCCVMQVLMHADEAWNDRLPLQVEHKCIRWNCKLVKGSRSIDSATRQKDGLILARRRTCPIDHPNMSERNERSVDHHVLTDCGSKPRGNRTF